MKNINKIILTVYNELINIKFYIKFQPVQHHNTINIGWLYHYTDKADFTALEEYFRSRIFRITKKTVNIAYLVKNIFTGKLLQDKENSYSIILLLKTYISNKAIYIHIMTKGILEYMYLVKRILKAQQ